MNGHEIETALTGLTIIVDTREQLTDKALRRFEYFGNYERQKLDFGDYSAQVTLEDGSVVSLANKVNIERKMNIDELAMCFGRERPRFEREFERMQADGGVCYLLCEGWTFEKVLRHKYRSKMSPDAVIGSLIAWMTKFKVRFIACDETTSGMLIYKILKREMKEELMNR